MNTPNKLTLIRVILIPFFVLFLMTDLLPASQLWALAVFAIASFTDFQEPQYHLRVLPHLSNN